MQFTRCIASKPGLFNGLDLDLSEKVVVISGRNGIGKSFLARTLIDGLWGIANESRMLDSSAWDDLYLEVLFSLNNDSYRLTNNSMKSIAIRESNGSGDRILMQKNFEDESGLMNSSHAQAKDDFNEFFNGFTSHSVSNTCFVPSPADCNGSTGIDYSAIKSVFLNDKTGFYDVHRELNRNPEGKSKLTITIDEFNLKKKKIEKEIQLIEIQESREEKLRNEKISVEKEIRGIRDEISILDKKTRLFNEIHAELERMDVLNAELETLKKDVKDEQEKVRRAEEMKKELIELYPQFNEQDSEADSNLDALQELFIEIRNLNEEIDRFHSQRKSRRQKLKKIILGLNLSAITAVITLLYRNSFSLDKDLAAYFVVGAADLFLSVVLSLVMIFSFRSGILEKLNEDKLALEKKLTPLLEKSRVQLEGYRLSELYEFLLQYFEDYVAFTDRKTEFDDFNSSLKSRPELKRIRDELDALYLEEESVRKKISEKIVMIDPDGKMVLEKEAISMNIRSFVQKKDELQNSLSVKEGILSKILGEIEDHPSVKEENQNLIGEMRILKKNIARLKKNERVFTWVGDVLHTAVQRREENLLNRLVDNTQQKFNFLTGNQHLGKIDEKFIRLFVTGEVLSENLNPAVFHTLLLAFKLSFSDFLIDANTSLPLIIDDPFLLMDDERVNKFKKLVHDLSQRRQIIIFTHSRDKQDWGNYIEL